MALLVSSFVERSANGAVQVAPSMVLDATEVTSSPVWSMAVTPTVLTAQDRPDDRQGDAGDRCAQARDNQREAKTNTAVTCLFVCKSPFQRE